MVAVLLIVTLAFTAAVLALVRDGAQLRRRLEVAERRLAALELEAATTIVVEPEPDSRPTPPRGPSQLLN